jgi:hypothetical protein
MLRLTLDGGAGELRDSTARFLTETVYQNMRRAGPRRVPVSIRFRHPATTELAMCADPDDVQHACRL